MKVVTSAANDCLKGEKLSLTEKTNKQTKWYFVSPEDFIFGLN
jgi:hypothetical protein